MNKISTINTILKEQCYSYLMILNHLNLTITDVNDIIIHYILRTSRWASSKIVKWYRTKLEVLRDCPMSEEKRIELSVVDELRYMRRTYFVNKFVYYDDNIHSNNTYNNYIALFGDHLWINRFFKPNDTELPYVTYQAYCELFVHKVSPSCLCSEEETDDMKWDYESIVEVDGKPSEYYDFLLIYASKERLAYVGR